MLSIPLDALLGPSTRKTCRRKDMWFKHHHTMGSWSQDYHGFIPCTNYGKVLHHREAFDCLTCNDRARSDTSITKPHAWTCSSHGDYHLPYILHGQTLQKPFVDHSLDLCPSPFLIRFWTILHAFVDFFWEHMIRWGKRMGDICKIHLVWAIGYIYTSMVT